MPTQKEMTELMMENVRLETSLKAQREIVETLEKRCSDQQEQIVRLQDALVAREAPDAYADRKIEETASEMSDDELAHRKRQHELAVANRKVLDGMVAPAFKDAEDMFDILTAGQVPEILRTHENDES